MPRRPKTFEPPTVTKNEIAAKMAAMLEVTSVSKDQVSSIQDIQETIENTKKELDNKEIEKMHQVELDEAKQLGIEETTIIESTQNEISNDFSQQLEESQMRYLEAIEDRDKFKAELELIKKENQTLLSENNKLKSDIFQLSSYYDCHHTDMSREIANYKADIEDLQETINVYEQNQFNYKLEIASLKEELKRVEQKLKDKGIHDERKNSADILRKAQPMYMPSSSLKKYSKKPIAVSKNGYDSWN